ncbi:hypothetical protein [Streptomyces silvisoli]|uniref:Uncharacterized protein n=1 Tax=Streptomyces silvisoli TaxID=3034235 RepID=A0ABT5ZGU4_9ACTN|nr:hypothetical protein [Streptomyces silvisoli]MDF3288835.1 hypothetical protein [Streptomyces silvisoli]
MSAPLPARRQWLYAPTALFVDAADVGDRAVRAALSRLRTPPGGDVNALRPAPEQPDPVTG